MFYNTIIPTISMPKYCSTSCCRYSFSLTNNNYVNVFQRGSDGNSCYARTFTCPKYDIACTHSAHFVPTGAVYYIFTVLFSMYCYLYISSTLFFYWQCTCHIFYCMHCISMVPAHCNSGGSEVGMYSLVCMLFFTTVRKAINRATQCPQTIGRIVSCCAHETVRPVCWVTTCRPNNRTTICSCKRAFMATAHCSTGAGVHVMYPFA